MENLQNIVNWKQVSFLLAKNEGSIRKNMCPTKYQFAVEDLLNKVQQWYNQFVKGEQPPKVFTPAEIKEILNNATLWD